MPRNEGTKKGNASWKPAHKLIVDKDPHWRYRMCDSDPHNIEKKKAEGWEFVNAASGIPGGHKRPSGTADGSNLDTGFEYRDLKLMAMPEDKAKKRDAYFADQTLTQTVGLKNRLKEQVAGSGVDSGKAVTGKIIID